MYQINTIQGMLHEFYNPAYFSYEEPILRILNKSFRNFQEKYFSEIQPAKIKVS
jgi:hypothetical protein